jgi:hypothetical protein
MVYLLQKDTEEQGRLSGKNGVDDQRRPEFFDHPI